MRLKKQILAMLLTLTCICSSFSFMTEYTYAATSYTVTFKNVAGSTITSSTVQSGGTLATTGQTQGSGVYAWFYDGSKKATTTTTVTKDMEVLVVNNTDILAQGKLDGNNIDWLVLSNNSLYVIGNGTLTAEDTTTSGNGNAGYRYTLSNGTLGSPDVMYDWLNKSAVGDEQSNGYGKITKQSDTVEFAVGETETYSNLYTYSVKKASDDLTSLSPWNAYDPQIENVYFGDDVNLVGNFSLFFNAANTNITSPSTLVESTYANLENVYMYADMAGVTSTNGMFAKCPKLKSVQTRDGSNMVLTADTDASYMFFQDNALETVPVISGTSNVVKFDYMFAYCSGLTGVDVSKINTSNALDLSYMFYHADKMGITWNQIKDWNTSKVISMVRAFQGTGDGSVLTGAVYLDNWNLSALVLSYYAFAFNNDITSVNWTGAATGAPTALKNATAMFQSDSSMTSLALSGLNLSSLEYADYMFAYSGVDDSTANLTNAVFTALKHSVGMFTGSGFSVINLNGTNPEALTNAKGMFSDCANLTSLGSNSLGEWTLANNTNTSYMFNNDKNLSGVNCGSWNMAGVTDISYMFANNKAIAIDVSAWNVSNVKTADAAFYNCDSITSMNLASWNVSNLESAFMMFAEMDAVSEITMTLWDTTRLTNTNGMFYKDKTLTSLDLSNWVNNKITDAAGMFAGTTSLASFNGNNLIKSTTTDIAYIFDGSSKMETLNILNWNLSNVKYMQGAFRGMTSLAELTTGTGYNTANVISMGATFSHLSKMTNSKIQSLLNTTNTSKVQDMYEMIAYCPLLTTLTLEKMDFAAATNLSRMTYSDTSLTKITLPSTIGSAVTDTSTGFKNVFYVSEPTLTTLDIRSENTPVILANYDWSADNRYFLKNGVGKINNQERSTYVFNSKTDSPASMEYTIESTFLLNGFTVNPIYAWTYNAEAVDGNALNTLLAKATETGTYVCSASIPALIKADKLSNTFTLSRLEGIVGLTATYKGNDVELGTDYNKDDVEVIVNGDNGNNMVLTSNDFTVNSQKVSNTGENIYIATYVAQNGTEYTADFTVTGIRVVGSIDAIYSGGEIRVGSDYDAKQVKVTAYYKDDTDKKEGFEITDYSLDRKTVTKLGSNTYTASYNKNTQGATLTDTFTVKGVWNIKSIEADYKGDSIIVGKEYDKNDVEVIIHFSDGTADLKTTAFLVTSLKVTVEGDNTFTATVTGDDNKKYTDSFIVKGVASSDKTLADQNAPKTGQLQSTILFLLMLVILCSGIVIVTTKKKNQ